MLSNFNWQIKKDTDRVNIVTGAGVSMSAGLPSGFELNKEILNVLANPWYNGDHEKIASRIPLETIFQSLADFDLQETISEVIKSLDSSNTTATHLAISKMAKQGSIENVVTFNFDRIHEKSFHGFSVVDSKNYGKTVVKSFKDEANIRFNLIKLHGTCEQEGVITFSEYITGFAPEIQNLIGKLLTDSFLLILGYGGWDYDFTQVIKSLIATGNVPKEVIWVDKYFPKTGGRTDIINLLKKNGVPVQATEMDFEKYCSNYYKVKEENYSSGYNLQKAIALLSLSEITKRKNILIQLSFQQPDINISEQVITQSEKLPGSFEAPYFSGLLHERKGNFNLALVNFKKVFSNDTPIERKILAAHKIFRLSDGKHRFFDRIENEKIPTALRNFAEFLEYSLLTDKDGLNRNHALEKCNTLPEMVDFNEHLSSTDWIKILIKVYTEIARLNYEAGLYSNTHRYDQSAIELARILADPEYLKSTTGNVGVSLMGLAYEAKTKNDETQLWNQAKNYLSESLAYEENFSSFHHALFTGNLGVVEFYLGNTSTAIELLNVAIDSLSVIYPNYCIFFYGKVSSFYAVKAEEDMDSSFLKFAKDKIVEGVDLMVSLDECDDIHLILEGISSIDRSSIKLEHTKYDLAKKKALYLAKNKLNQNNAQ